MAVFVRTTVFIRSLPLAGISAQIQGTRRVGAESGHVSRLSPVKVNVAGRWTGEGGQRRRSGTSSRPSWGRGVARCHHHRTPSSRYTHRTVCTPRAVSTRSTGRLFRFTPVPPRCCGDREPWVQAGEDGQPACRRHHRCLLVDYVVCWC